MGYGNARGVTIGVFVSDARRNRYDIQLGLVQDVPLDSASVVKTDLAQYVCTDRGKPQRWLCGVRLESGRSWVRSLSALSNDTRCLILFCSFLFCSVLFCSVLLSAQHIRISPVSIYLKTSFIKDIMDSVWNEWSSVIYMSQDNFLRNRH